MSRIVVTGGAGFVGSHLCERLLADGNQVVCVDNLISGDADNLAELGGTGRFTFIEGDVSEGFAIDGQVDEIYHLASPASPSDYVKFPMETLAAGSAGTRNCLEMALDKNARFLFTSTSEVYGDPAVHPQPETYWGNVNPIGPRSVYDEAKRFGEAITMAFHREHGLATHIARLFNTIGPRMRAGDGRVVPTFITQALAGEPLTVFGDGSQTRSIGYVGDVVDGLVRLMASGHATPVNLGNPQEISMLDLARLIGRLAGSGGSEIEFRDLPEDDPRQRKPDISTAGEVIGWQPTTSMEEALLSTIGWFRQLGDRRPPASV